MDPRVLLYLYSEDGPYISLMVEPLCCDERKSWYFEARQFLEGRLEGVVWDQM